MKISPVIIYLLYFLVVAIPMNFTAPTGPVMALRETVQISPAVPGRVIDVAVEAGVDINQGDLLFRIDPAP